MSETPVIYLMYGAFGDLLYVGRTTNMGPRTNKHANDKGWWRLVRRIELQHCATEDDARSGERHLIETFRPPLNVMHKGKGTTSEAYCSQCDYRLGWREGFDAIQIDRAWFGGSWYCARCMDFDPYVDPPWWAAHRNRPPEPEALTPDEETAALMRLRLATERPSHGEAGKCS